MAFRLAFLLVALVAFYDLPAYAGIGEVGPPKTQKAASDQADKAVSPPPAVEAKPVTDVLTASEPEKKPLIEIDFSSKRTYLDRAVSEGTRASEAAKPGVVYEVISYVPSTTGDTSRSQNERINQQNQSNVNAVVDRLRAQGIPASRINVMTKPYPQGKEADLASQKVSVFVK